MYHPPPLLPVHLSPMAISPCPQSPNGPQAGMPLQEMTRMNGVKRSSQAQPVYVHRVCICMCKCVFSREEQFGQGVCEWERDRPECIRGRLGVG